MKRFVPLTFILVLVLTAPNISWNVVSAQSVDELEEEIKELEKEELELKEKQSDLDSEKSETEHKIEENLEKQDTVKSDIASIDKQLDATQASIQAKENEIQSTNQEIDELTNKIEELKVQMEELKEEIKKLQEKIEKREELLRDRLRSIQQSGGTMRYLEVLLGSSSFADFISRTAAVNIMMDQDKAIMESLKEDRIMVENKKTEVEDSKAEVEDKKGEVEGKKLALESQKQDLVALQSQLDQQIAEKETLMAQLEEEHEHLEEYKFTLADEQAMLQAQNQAVQKAREIAEKEKSELSQLSQSNPGSGDFIWPAAGSRSSNFGNRVDPITYERSFHLGIDISGPSGTPIYAAASGVAMPGDKSGTYGNHVLIASHINGVDYTTLYAHMSSYTITAGQVVQQGDLIGYMGSTGRSTGPHLHFEIHKGGWIGFYPPNSNVVNPLDYLP
ncbi:murein hydrolase activator EnvC family protein [Ornithinibacillus salinisoli]|uniref:Murein hydrolase activator EnvC family protein n=1 Tax=Ornithinibacillus salinisoli TaxID=1848459 RepID=A0ABW4W2C2_9BACI